MSLLSRASKQYLEQYRVSIGQFHQAAREAQAFVEEAIGEYSHAIHAVKARAKNVESVREKLRRKKYENPELGLTDLIGVRVITYFAADVDVVASVLEQNLEVSSGKSRDARRDLEVDKFGYRSLHLIARLKSGDSRRAANGELRRRWFEIQIRSILDHAWAEIEHETVYKAAIDFPAGVRRRYRAVAGALEVIENAFSGLTRERDVLVDIYKAAYRQRRDLDKKFDAARLVAFMEVKYPNAPSLRDRQLQGTVIEPTHNSALVSMLKTAKVYNARLLSSALSGRAFQQLVERFAAETGCTPAEVSHRARLILAAVVKKPQVISAQFPELLVDPALTRLALLGI